MHVDEALRAHGAGEEPGYKADERDERDRQRRRRASAQIRSGWNVNDNGV